MRLSPEDYAKLRRLRELVASWRHLEGPLAGLVLATLCKGTDTARERERIGALRRSIAERIAALDLGPLDHAYCSAAGIEESELFADRTAERRGWCARVIDLRRDGTFLHADGAVSNPERARQLN